MQIVKVKVFTDNKIVESWLDNVNPWIKAIENHEIETRQLITNQAIIDAILKKAPAKVLDIGCGEGWLVRELVSRNINCLGIDVVPGFIEYASEKIGRYKALSYEQLSAEEIGEQFDVVVCNFSLFGEHSVNHLFQQVPKLLNFEGSFIVQTLQPGASTESESYSEGWREGSWAGFNENFTNPAPWYFRAIESWKALFIDAGLSKLEITEPENPETRIPASIIFCGETGN